MAGHNKWSKIKHTKAVQDSKKAALFTKMAHNIALAARDRGGDPDKNFELRLAVDRAKSVNMPKENIDRAIKRGTGELNEGKLEELFYEGVGPAKTQFIIKSVTDNKNRAAADIKHIFTKYGGGFGSVMWNFRQLGVIVLKQESLPESGLDELELALIDSGSEDIEIRDGLWIIYTKPNQLRRVRDMIRDRGIALESAELEYLAQELLELSPDDQEKVEKFLEALDSCQDVADYYTNFNY